MGQYKEWESKEFNGYFTVEAAFIIPLALFLMGALIYLSFFLYNKCVASQEAYLLAFRLANEQGLAAYDIPLQESGKMNKTVYLGNCTIDKNIKQDKNEITVDIKVGMQAFAIKPFMSSDHFGFFVRGKSTPQNPVKNLRLFRIIKKTVKKAGG